MVTFESHILAFPKLDRRSSFFNPSRTHTCIACGGRIGDFDTILSELEYENSGLCQHCQDRVSPE